ncbi:signal transduction histidine kinase [Streptomyces umbrinus]|uniref:histidine kinase n=1 Tax=Streptomyces umbrinus TaxID=67370 RepID=A0ABU0STZ0_9ACTN|nr:histidine kinase [Streptomyces umbrinus]MDQ1027014.1 signal transduction histidine kinase [Streptomyces umbrinus]
MRKTTRQAAGATVQLARAAVLTFGTMLFLTVLLITATATLAVVGAGLLPETVTLVRRIAGAKRRQVAEWTGERIPEAYLPLDDGPLRARLRTAVQDPGTLMDLRWMFAQYGYGSVLPILVLPLWPAALLVDGVRCGLLNRAPLVLPLITRLADLEARWSTALLKPSPRARLSERVEELTATRAGVVAAHEAELRRMEQDLQDGSQARLVSLSMRLGLAKRAYEHDPATARKLLDDAQDQAEEALTELRHVVRGIHPPILTDRGLAGAVRALAASSGLDVTVDTGGLETGPRAPAGVEAAAYFTVAEALTNAAKHSGSHRASVQLTCAATGLTVTVSDEGHGGADETTGSSLLGMRRRVAALDGTIRLTSPTGGPTVIEAGLPCGW